MHFADRERAAVILPFATLFLSLLCGTGCAAGGHSQLTANQARYPISFSSYVRDADGALLHDGTTLHRVGQIDHEYSAYALAWGIAGLNTEEDISEIVNRAVEAAGGEAVVNLSVTAGSCGWNAFVYWMPLYMVPAFPGCVNTRVQGDIVRRAPRP